MEVGGCAGVAKSGQQVTLTFWQRLQLNEHGESGGFRSRLTPSLMDGSPSACEYRASAGEKSKSLKRQK
jgi:hypothetical protein